MPAPPDSPETCRSPRAGGAASSWRAQSNRAGFGRIESTACRDVDQHVDGGDTSHRGNGLRLRADIAFRVRARPDLDHLGEIEAHHVLHEEKAKQLHNSP